MVVKQNNQNFSHNKYLLILSFKCIQWQFYQASTVKFWLRKCMRIHPVHRTPNEIAEEIMWLITELYYYSSWTSNLSELLDNIFGYWPVSIPQFWWLNFIVLYIFIFWNSKTKMIAKMSLTIPCGISIKKYASATLLYNSVARKTQILLHNLST